MLFRSRSIGCTDDDDSLPRVGRSTLVIVSVQDLAAELVVARKVREERLPKSSSSHNNVSRVYGFEFSSAVDRHIPASGVVMVYRLTIYLRPSPHYQVLVRNVTFQPVGKFVFWCE